MAPPTRQKGGAEIAKEERVVVLERRVVRPPRVHSVLPAAITDSFRKSTPPQTRQLNILISNSKQ